MIGQWKQFLLDQALEWGVPGTGEWSFLLHNNYQPHYSNLNLLWFHNGDQFPRVVTKVYREPRILEREFENLKQAFSRAPKWVPKPLYLGSQGGFWTLWMEGVPGLPFHAAHDYAPATLRSMVEMLISMHAGLRQPLEKSDGNRYRRSVLSPLEMLAQFEDSDLIREGCARIAAGATVDWINSLPMIPQHGDLFAGNLLRYRRKWHVIDWESFGAVDLPFYDLFTLLLSLLRAGGEFPEQWDRSLLRQVPALIECYARGLGLSSADVRLLLPLTLANWFHLQWSDGRHQFTVRMFATIRHYFENSDAWEAVFISGLER